MIVLESDVTETSTQVRFISEERPQSITLVPLIDCDRNAIKVGKTSLNIDFQAQ